jgi:uncharacterized membrane protein
MDDSQRPAPIEPEPTGQAGISRTANLISWTLRGGVAASVALILLGTLISFVRHPQYFSSGEDLQHLVQPGNASLSALVDVWHGILAFKGQAIVAAGLLVLILTPVARVAISVFAFLEERDFVMAAITLAVLVILIVSFFLGRVEG